MRRSITLIIAALAATCALWALPALAAAATPTVTLAAGASAQTIPQGGTVTFIGQVAHATKADRSVTIYERVTLLGGDGATIIAGPSKWSKFAAIALSSKGGFSQAFTVYVASAAPPQTQPCYYQVDYKAVYGTGAARAQSNVVSVQADYL
jgi:hypothetical protein